MQLERRGFGDGMADQATPRHQAGAEIFAFRLWGRFSARRLSDGADITPRGRKARALLAYLVLENEPASRERLTGLLWSERGQAQAYGSLRQCLQELREFSRFIDTERQRIGAHADLAQTDMGRMLTGAAEGNAEALAADLDASGNDLLEDLDGLDPAFDEWLGSTRAARKERLIAAAQGCVRGALGQDRTEAAADLANALVRLDPLDESVARLAMEAAHRAGKHDAVQRTYLRLRERLRHELAVAPSPETDALHQRLLSKVADREPAAAEPEQAPAPSSLSVLAARPAPWRTRPWLRAAAAALLVLMVAAAALFAWSWRSGGSREPVSIAVLPFRNLSAGDDYFAEGVAEEVLAQLASEPQLRVAGRTSSALFKDAADVRDVGRRLDVDYVLEGSVRRAGQNVRVDVALVGTRNGMRLWSHAFQGRLDDIFAIQRSIGSEVASNLRRRLARPAPVSGPLTTTGEVYALYLTARGLIREREPAKMEAAEGLLRRAVQLDPNYAPAWSSLASAVTMNRFNRDRAAARRQPSETALRFVRRALALAPDLGEAHATMGLILDRTPTAALAYLERSVELDPNNAEAWYWLYLARQNRLDFEGALEAARRMAAIDPLWIRSEWATVVANDMGYRGEALRREREIVARHPDRFMQLRARWRMASINNDPSEGYRLAEAMREMASPDRQPVAEQGMAFSLIRLGFYEEASRMIPDPLFVSMSSGQSPSRAQLRRQWPQPSDFWNWGESPQLVFRLLLAEGRGLELLSFYDAAFDSPEAMSRHPDGLGEFVQFAPSVALALRQGGRGAEAERLLALADRTAQAAIRRGRVPASFQLSCAQLWAVMGQREAAIAALERVVMGGWDPSLTTAAPKFSDQPVFASLADDPRLQRLDRIVQGHLARERRELQALLANRTRAGE